LKYLKSYKREKISIEQPEVLRYLGYGKSKEDISPAIKEVVENQIALAYSLIKPRAVYSFIDNLPLKDYYIFKGAIKIALGICTIGSELEDLADSHFRKGAYLEWLVLDACGTVATEKLVELVGDEIRKSVSEEGLKSSERLSPGCAHWQLDGQHLVFSHFSHETAGVTINESYMMRPRKSVSFAYKLYGDGIEEVRSDKCLHCELYRCNYRKEYRVAKSEIKRSSVPKNKAGHTKI